MKTICFDSRYNAPINDSSLAANFPSFLKSLKRKSNSNELIPTRKYGFLHKGENFSVHFYTNLHHRLLHR